MYNVFLPLICPLKAQRRACVLTLKGMPDWRVRRFTSATELMEDWPRAKREDDFWLKPEVLSFLLNQPQGITTEPLLVENISDGRKILLTAQTFYFNAGGQVSDAAKGETSGFDLRRRLLSPFSFRVLCLGQLLVSGNYCSAGLDKLTATEASDLLPAIADALMGRRHSYAGAIIKDLYAVGEETPRMLRTKGFYPLPADPRLAVNILPHWMGMDDYLTDLKSKYRVRYRRARGKLEGLTRRRLSPEEVGCYRERLFELYKCTAAGSDFNAVALTPEYFPWLASVVNQEQLHGGLVGAAVGLIAEQEETPSRIDGYFTSSGKLVGFTSTISNGKTLHAHYLGMEDAYKTSHHLYHNMLFDLLEQAIEGDFTTLDYARTAPEIKTSVGAVAEEPAVLLKARSGVLNRLVPLFATAVYKQMKWTARNPFRG